MGEGEWRGRVTHVFQGHPVHPRRRCQAQRRKPRRRRRPPPRKRRPAARDDHYVPRQPVRWWPLQRIRSVAGNAAAAPTAASAIFVVVATAAVRKGAWEKAQHSTEAGGAALSRRCAPQDVRSVARRVPLPPPPPPPL
jgi:hypothetical protein